ncbi:MAG TPA: hypothetical protein VFF73_18740, partial [Planctomycetota bacterium]|nr:hypothetical protein [Planctomycetota bacterium]
MDLRPLAKRLARLRLVDPERDLIERLDRLDVAGGGLRYAATSAPTPRAAQGLVAKLERALPELAHGLRVIADDRPKLVGRNVIGRALARVPAPLPLAFSWRRGDRAPPRAIPRVRVGPLLGYPPCCVR